MAYIINLIDQRERAALFVDGYDAEWDAYIIGLINEIDALINAASEEMNF